MEEQHPVPRQITTFEFKLIGFMTLKQFIYLVVFVPLGYIVYKIIPIPVINALLGLIVAAAGFMFAFFPVNDRPLDVWVKNLIKRLISPTQFFYKKGSESIAFLGKPITSPDPTKIFAHIESQEKLAEYLAARPGAGLSSSDHEQNIRKKAISDLFAGVFHPVQKQEAVTVDSLQSAQEDKPKEADVEPQDDSPKARFRVTTRPQPKSPFADMAKPGAKEPFFMGVVKNKKNNPLPGLLVYVKDHAGTPLRLLKTNAHGVFATFNSIPPGDYMFEIKDPNETFFFDTMSIQLTSHNTDPLEFFSKELL